MLLTEIIDTKAQERKVKALPKILNRKGSFARVEDDKSDPHMVKKDSIYDSAYDAYISMLISENQMGSNPFAPRVYRTTKLSTDSNHGDKVYRYQMEKLISASELENSWDQMSKDEILPYFLDQMGIKKEDRVDFFHSVYEISRYLKRIIHRYISTVNIDPNLAKIFNIAEYLVRNNEHFEWDLHEENFMFRRTPVGYQLVITDPIYSKEQIFKAEAT